MRPAWRVRTGTATLALALLAACAGDPEPRPAAPTPGAPPAGATAPAPPPLRTAAPAARPVAVGGCGRACDTAPRAASAFIDATAGGDLAAVLSLVDPTRLVVDGVPFGDRWAAQWAGFASDARTRAMHDVARDLSGWTAGLPVDRVRDATAAGPRPLATSATAATFRFDPPGAPPWRITLAPRGLEWLVIDVRRIPDGPSRP